MAKSSFLVFAITNGAIAAASPTWRPRWQRKRALGGSSQMIAKDIMTRDIVYRGSNAR